MRKEILIYALIFMLGLVIGALITEYYLTKIYTEIGLKVAENFLNISLTDSGKDFINTYSAKARVLNYIK